jgi:predicted Fe-S protein YdhL (DUF1289 family)
MLKVNNKERSPCVNNCCLDQHDVCVGCYRTITEIIGWRDKSDHQKIEILAQCTLRKNNKNHQFPS